MGPISAPPAKKPAPPSAEEQRAQAVKRLEDMGLQSAEGLKLKATIAEALTTIAQSMSRIASTLESLDATTKETSKNLKAIAEKILKS